MKPTVFQEKKKKSIYEMFAGWQFGLMIIVAGFIFTPTIYSQSWSNTRLMTTVGDNLYTIETDGKWFHTNMATGVKTVHAYNYHDHRFLFSNGTNIYTINSSGDLFRHYHTTKIAASNWRDTRLLVADANYFYTIETDGILYRTSFTTLVKTRIGTNTWASAKLIFTDSGNVAIIGYPQIYAVNSTNGATASGGPTNLLSSSRLGANVKAVGMFTIEADGLYRTSESGTTLVKTKVTAGWANAKFLFSFGNELWVIASDGLLKQISYLSNGGYSKVFPAPTPTPTPTPTSTPTTEVNLALGKPANQSSNIGGGYDASLGLASKAVDGNTDGRWGSGSVTHTANAKTATPFWEVDLLADYNVNKIQIWNRTDCCSEALTNYKIWTKTATGNWEEFYPGLKTYTPGETYPRTFTANRQARYVRVVIDSPSAVLMLAEVKVFGTLAGPGAIPTPTPTPAPIPTPTPNISDGKAVDPKEEKLWAEVEKANTVKAYQLYLTEYKNGTHADTAKGRIDLLSDTSVKPDSTPTNVNAAKTSEDQYWEEVERLEKSSPEIYLNALETYINKYPLDGKYLGKAYLRRDLILKSAKPTPTPTPTPIATPTPLPKVSPDDEFWNKIKDSNRVEDFEVYLKAFPDGDHKADAMLNISRLKPAKPKEPEPVKQRECDVEQDANLRAEPNNKGKIIGTLKKGRTVVLIEDDGDWIRVGEIRNGRIVSLGWVVHKLLYCDGDEL